jgi:hypothetical protein
MPIETVFLCGYYERIENEVFLFGDSIYSESLEYSSWVFGKMENYSILLTNACILAKRAFLQHLEFAKTLRFAVHIFMSGLEVAMLRFQYYPGDWDRNGIKHERGNERKVVCKKTLSCCGN